VGGAAGLLASLWGVDLLLRLIPERLPRAADIGVDHRVFLFAAITSTIAGLLVGLTPALQSARADVIERLKTAGGRVHGGARAKVRNALVVAQVAIAIVLLAGAALLVRTLVNLQRVDTGIATDRLLTARVWLPQPNTPEAGPYYTHEKRLVLVRRILERLGASPEIAAAGICTTLPGTQDSGTASFAAEGWTPDRRDLATATVASVTPGYFPALGMRLVAGRLLENSDNERSARTVVINETLAKSYFGGEDPVGRRFRYVNRRGQVSPNAQWITIVGVVGNVAEDAVDQPVRPQIYQSLLQTSNLSLAIVARGRQAAPSANAVVAAVQESDPNLPLYAVRTGGELMAAQLAQRKFATYLINAFAASALLLAAVGLHGVIAYSVRQRTHEIGVRVALGASASRILALVLGQAARVTAFGVAIGVLAAVLLSRLVRKMLFNVSPNDPLTLTAVVIVLGLVVGAAAFMAAMRAARIEASVALRQE
jgi:putative ABC transport system permease protein